MTVHACYVSFSADVTAVLVGQNCQSNIQIQGLQKWDLHKIVTSWSLNDWTSVNGLKLERAYE